MSNESHWPPVYRGLFFMIRKLKSFPWEAVIWIAGFVFLASMPVGEGTHFTICPISRAGFDFCPGCGLGKSIGYLFHGKISESFHAHPLGILAVIVLTFRILHLIKLYIQHDYGKSN